MSARENVTRLRRRSPYWSFNYIDKLHLDVTYVGNQDMLAPPGSHGFKDTDPGKMSPKAMVSIGEFATTAHDLFVTEAPRFTPHKNAQGARTSGLGFDFEIAAQLNSWPMSWNGRTATIGERGTVWVDPE